MSKNIYIINTGEEDIYSLFSFFEELSLKGYNLFFLLNKSKIFNLVSEKKINIKKINIFFKDGSKFKTLILKFFSIFFVPFIFFYFLNLKRKNKIEAVFLFGLSSQIIFRIPLFFLKIRMFWVKNNDVEEYLKFFSSRATWLCFNTMNKNKLIRKGIKEEKIKLLLPGLRIKDTKRQDNIFNKLAQKNQNNFHHTQPKFFTIGTFVNLDLETNLENLFLAIQKALDVIPNIQLIVVGDGKNRKKLDWLSKKMKIDNLVWFVGEQGRLGKWFDAFDIFVLSSLNQSFKDFEIALRALSAQVPIIAPFNYGLDDLIKNGENGLIIEKEDSEEILKAVIKLKKDKNLRKKLGEKGILMVQNEFNMQKMLDNFLKIIN